MNQTEKNEIVTLLDDQGEEATFEHVLTFLHEGERYVALTPMVDGQEEGMDDEAEVVLLRIERQDGEDVYVSIDNEVMLHEVFDAFLDMMDDMGEE